jgi:hypothetical protein
MPSWWEGLPGYNTGNPNGSMPSQYNGRMAGYSTPYGWLSPDIRSRVGPTNTYDPSMPYENSLDAPNSYGFYNRFRPDLNLLDQAGQIGSAERFNARREMRRQHELQQWVAAGGKPENFVEWESSGIDWNSFGNNQDRNAARTNYYMQNLLNLINGGGGSGTGTTTAPLSASGRAMPSGSIGGNSLVDALARIRSRVPGEVSRDGGKQGWGGAQPMTQQVEAPIQNPNSAGKPGWSGAGG